MKIELNITKAVKDICTRDGIVLWISVFILPVCVGILSFPFLGWFSVWITITILMIKFWVAGAMHEQGVSDNIALWFMWITLILLAPITIPLDIFASVGKGIKNWFTKKKSRKKIRKSWQYLLEKGLDDRKIEIDLLNEIEKDLSKSVVRLFEEIITDQLGRSLFKKSRDGVSEKIKIVRFEKTGDKISLIGSFTVTERSLRDDGSENTNVKGRVFGITFSVSEHTGVCKVFHHTSRTLHEVHEDEQLEDLWFDLLSASGISSQTASDPWQRRMQKCVIVTDENSEIQNSTETELE